LTTASNVPRARCVKLASFEQLCVKESGRIYLAAGAFHTPELLMKSGIGKGGDRVDNPEVRCVALHTLRVFILGCVV
jgi:choline dehydrogenase-like flavoprotein